MDDRRLAPNVTANAPFAGLALGAEWPRPGVGPGRKTSKVRSRGDPGTEADVPDRVRIAVRWFRSGREYSHPRDPARRIGSNNMGSVPIFVKGPGARKVERLRAEAPGPGQAMGWTSPGRPRASGAGDLPAGSA